MRPSTSPPRSRGSRSCARTGGTRQAGWYNDTFNVQPPSMPLARLWSAYPLFETLVAVAAAQPTDTNMAALTTFADAAATLYWNPNVKPYGGYGWYPGNGARRRTSTSTTPAGGACRSSTRTRVPRCGLPSRRAPCHSAPSSARAGTRSSAAARGGTRFHHHKTIEPLAAAVMIGTRLYEAQQRHVGARLGAEAAHVGERALVQQGSAASTSAARPTTPSWTTSRA